MDGKRMTGWAIGALLLAAVPAGAQAPAARPDQAARHFAVAHAGLESAEIHAEMLEAITKRPELYDEAHGRHFVDRIDQALGHVRTHVGHLEPLVESEEERRQLKALTDRLDEAERAANGLAAGVSDPGRLHRTADDVERRIERAEEPLERLAEQMKVPIDL